MATGATDFSKCSQEYGIGHNGKQGLYWPIQKVEKMSNDGNNAARKWLAGNRTSALKEAVRPKCRAGNTNTSLCVDLSTQVESNLLPNITDPNITEYLWTSPAHNTINPAQWSAEEREHGL